jgi:hypothetical protein
MPKKAQRRVASTRHVAWLFLLWSALVPLFYVLVFREFTDVSGPVTLDIVGDAVALPNGETVVVLNLSRRTRNGVRSHC